MHAYTKTPHCDYSESPSAAESLDELWADEDFYDELIDALNQNFVLEVEASLTRKD